MGATVEMNEAFLHFRRALRTARAAVQADAEAYMEVIRVVESLGAYLKANCAGRTPSGLGEAREIIRSVLFPGPDVWLDSPPREPSVAVIYERLRRMRNATVHEGALSRSAGVHAVRLSLAIEEALMEKLKGDESVAPWMVPDPIVAKSWHTISHIRMTLLSGGFNLTPADPQHCVSPDERLSNLLKPSWPAGALPVLVVEGDRLVGALTPHDLLV